MQTHCFGSHGLDKIICMSTDGAFTSATSPVQEQPASTPATPAHSSPSRLGWIALAVAAVSMGSSVLLWQKVTGMQEQLARQTATATTQSAEARALARESQDLVRDTNTRLALVEAKVQESTLQRSQFEDLVRSISRSRDDTLLLDVESSLRMALQQAELSGSLEPLVATMRTSAQRMERSAQPRLIPVQRAIEQDIERLERANVTDTAGLLGRLDELVRVVDDLPLVNSVVHHEALNRGSNSSGVPLPAQLEPGITPAQWAWWKHWSERIGSAVMQEASELVRIRRIDRPESILIAPEQAFFLRENLKLKLLNVRLGLLARQYDSARADLGAASTALTKYFDQQSRRTQSAQTLLLQIQTHLRRTEQPSINDTLSALATAASSQ